MEFALILWVGLVILSSWSNLISSKLDVGSLQRMSELVF